MLFLPESVYKERRRLCKDLEGQKIIPAAAFRRMLEMDPDDDLALRELGILAETAGDSATAEEYFWRALHAHPLGWSAYLALSRHFGQQPDQQALSMGLAELAFRKLPLNEEFSDDGAPDPETAILPDLDGFEDMSKVEQYEALADELRRRRDLEPAAVTARLRPYRLIHLLHEGADIDEQFVNTMIAERTAIVPLLIGVLRGWARMYLPGDETFTVEIAIAILGEIGDAGVIPHLLEFAALADPDLSGVAGWALDRICELHPDQVSKVLGEIAPRLVVRDRIPVIGRVVRFPKIDASGALLEKLSENLGQAPKKDLDAFVPPLLGAMVLAKGRPGVEMARSALRRNTGLLSRNSRAECEEMIEVLGAGPFPTPPIPEPSPYSVYDICAGEAHWDEEEDEDFEHMDDDESYFSPPPTVHKAPKPGRNEPCWCGSGKKYKKCHQEEDERNERSESAPLRAPALEREFDELRRAIGSFLPDTATIKERRELLQEFLDDDERNETGISAFTDWMVHDWISPRSGLGVMEEFIQRQGDDLTPRKREVLKSWSASHTALYEVQEVATGTGITVKDLITDEVFFVHDISLSKALVLWDGLLARVIDGERGREFSGVGLSVPRRQLEPMRRWLQEDRRSAGLPWPEYFKQNLPRIRRKPVELAKEWRSSLRLQNNDGHELILSKAVYKILDQPALIGALGAYFEPEEAGVRYVWLGDSKGDDGRTLLGSLTMEGAELVLECNSKKRLARGKKLLASAAGPALKHLRNEFTDHAELLRLASETPNPRHQKVDEIPIEVRQKLIGEVMEKHFAKWPDTPLPALDGKTARQAVKTEAGRKKVTALLRDFENSEERKRRQGEPFYDISRLRDELGLTN